MNWSIMKGALVGGAINAIINGTIKWFTFRDMESIPLSVDCITNSTHTVLSTAIPLAFLLSMILTLAAYFTIKGNKKAFYPTAVWLIIKHGFFTFGVVTAMAVMWQFSFGSIQVGPLAATFIVGMIAAVVTVTVNYLTISNCQEE
jgi:vacuolar-type H+-ATPase subunit I/STV1